MLLSFYPGPSRVYDSVPDYVRDAYDTGILSINHRSAEFVDMSERTIRLLKDKLDIPGDYTVFYTSSATECWEIIAQSVIEHSSLHLFNGAFGEKWFTYTKRLRPAAQALPFSREEEIDLTSLSKSTPEEVICLTQNETSNGTQVTNDVLRALRTRLPDHLIAVDATSSMAGVYLDFAAADIWFASVQKCFGLPAGLGLLICSPQTMKRVRTLGEDKHYNSLTFMADMMNKWQTPYTPNVLNIYLLGRVMEEVQAISLIDKEIVNRYSAWIDVLQDRSSLRHLIENESVHSHTVIPVAATDDMVTRIKQEARKNDILLGEGYGDLKSSTFRIANFPALHPDEVATLQSFLKNYE